MGDERIGFPVLGADFGVLTSFLPHCPCILSFYTQDISSTSPARGPRLPLAAEGPAPCMSDIFEKQGKYRKPILGMLDHVFEDRLRNHGAGWTTTSACAPEPERHMPH